MTTQDAFQRASDLIERKRFKAAMRDLEAPAREGDPISQHMLGYCWDMLGPSGRDEALRWYRRAARNGEGCAATNIGVLYRDEGRVRLARAWFRRAVRLGHADALYDLALLARGQARVALLRRMLRHRDLTPFVREQGEQLLAREKPR